MHRIRDSRSAFTGLALFFALSLIAPQRVFAHGALLIRIGEVSRLIDVATNKFAELYLERAELYRMDQNWAAAESDYIRAEQLATNLASAVVCHAGMLADSGRFKAARTMFTTALQRFPESGEAFIGRARVFVKLGQRKAAIADFRRGLELLQDPALEYYVELAEALAAERATNDALSILDRGIKKMGPLPALETPAIELEVTRKNYADALARIDSLMPQLLRRENWLARRGAILVEAGRKVEARKSYEDALVAVKALPSRIQQSSPMLRLNAQVDEALRQIANPALAGK